MATVPSAAGDAAAAAGAPVAAFAAATFFRSRLRSFLERVPRLEGIGIG